MRLSKEDIASVMHVNMEDAAHMLRVSVVTLKRACKRHNIGKWPFRKLRAVARRKSILMEGRRLTPSQREIMVNCEKALENFRQTVLSDFAQVPAIDSAICADDHPVNVLPIVPVQMDLNCVSPAYSIDANMRRLIHDAFLPH